LRPDRPYNPGVQAPRFGLFRVRSPLLAESLLFSLPAGTEMVHFPALPSPPYGFRWRYDGITRRGLPHSDISGSKLVCSSPKRFAADRVLHRLLAPRHSPYALSSLTIGMQELTIALLEMGSARDSPPSKPSLKNTACFFVDRKNYRLQDIQLSKNISKALQDTSKASANPLTRQSAPRGFNLCCRANRSSRTLVGSVREGWWRIPGSNR
jgi:hypothetical protein